MINRYLNILYKSHVVNQSDILIPVVLVKAQGEAQRQL